MTEDEATRIWRLNFQLSTGVLDEAAAEIEALGVEVKAFFVLDGVEEQPYPAQLANRLSIPRPTMTLYLKDLEAKGFLSRAIDPGDLRRHRLRLTDSGRTTVAKARAILSRCYGRRLDRLSGPERAAFSTLLEKLAD